MNKVVFMSQFKKKSIRRFGYLESVGIEKYEDMLDIQRGIIEELYVETERFLRKVDFPVNEFVLDDKSAREFISADLVEAFEGGEEALCISYIASIEGVEYRTLATAEIDGEDITIYVELFQKAGNEWLVFAGDNQWERGPGEDFF